jgi:hypothetical protein
MEELEIDSAIDIWKISSDFFKSDPMNVLMGIIVIIGFCITIRVYSKVKSFNSTYKRGRIIEKYQEQYKKFEKILTQSNVPTDIHARVRKTNNQLYFNIGRCQTRKIKKQFNSIDAEEDNGYLGLSAFLSYIIITLERDIV